ncbi:hypothetical protein BH09PLA1_BH09PLA1_09940 [soil metagenome]
MNSTETWNQSAMPGQKPTGISKRTKRAFISFGLFGIAVLALLSL